MGYEFELKFRATSAQQAAVRQALSDSWKVISMETTYYADPLRRLRALHYTLRRRLENGVSVCTLKTPMGDGGRGEWEVEANTIEEAIPELCKLGAPELLLDLTADGVSPCCGARFTRQAALIQAGETALEIALDEGVLFGGGKEVPLGEIEVELKSGTREQAIAFASALAETYGLQIQPKSKISRALALLDD